MAQTTSNNIKSKLIANNDKLIAYPIAELRLFGSFLREDAHEDSDIDILVIFTQPVGYFAFFTLKALLEEITGRRVDLVTPNGLHPQIKKEIQESAQSLWVPNAA